MPTVTSAPEPRAITDPALIAACDVLVVRALELVGKRLVRVDRSRYARLAGRPFHEAHLLWQPDAEMLDKALAGAWTQVPQVVRDHSTSGVEPRWVSLALDRYVRDLVRASRGHEVDHLRYVLRVFQ
jgi:hypothetical protein